jgi:hypothetical protein
VLLSPANPATGRRGQQNLTVQITGTNTHFAQDVTTLNMGAGVTIVSPLTVTSPTTASAVVNIDGGAAAGARAITVTTGGEVASVNDGFTVLENPDQLPKTCATASNMMQSMVPGSSRMLTGWLDVAGVEDWFAVSLVADIGIKLTISSSGPGSEFDMTAYNGTCGGQQIGTTVGSTLKEITIPPGQVKNFQVRVTAARWAAANSSFTVKMTAQ